EGVQWTGADFRGAMFDKDAGPVHRCDSTPDFASPPSHEKEMETMARWVEEFLKIAPQGTTGSSQRTPFQHPREQAGSAELRELLKTFDKTLASQGLQGKKIHSSFQDLLDILEKAPENEPPEAWKPAISLLLNRLPGAGQNFTEVFNLLLETLS